VSPDTQKKTPKGEMSPSLAEFESTRGNVAGGPFVTHDNGGLVFQVMAPGNNCLEIRTYTTWSEKLTFDQKVGVLAIMFFKMSLAVPA
jgi:hypothetical protein